MTQFPDHRRILVAFMAFAMGCLAGLPGRQPHARADVLPRAPRELQNRLSLAREALALKRYSDAVRMLDSLMAGDEDRFATSGAAGGTCRTLKAETTALLAALPPAGRKEYEFLVGDKSRWLLRQACKQRDVAALARLARHYACVRAGAEAAFLVGYDALDRGRPREALRWFGRLARTPELTGHIEPELTLAVARAQLWIGRAERAQQTLDRLGSLRAGVRFRIGDETFTTADDPQRVMLALAGAMRANLAEQVPAPSGWPMFRRDAARQGMTQWSGTPGALLWKVDAPALTPTTPTRRRTTIPTLTSTAPQIPAGHPLLVDSLLLARTPQRLIAIDLASGRQVWEFPWGGDSIVARPQSAQVHSVLRSAGLLADRQRRYDDAAYGQFASDGRLVFLLDGLSAATGRSTPVVVMVNGRRTVTRTPPKSDNRLVALELQKEGKLAWSVGSTSGEDEPALAGAFFLGPPLVHENRLHVLAEMEGEIRLCTLDAATGALEWSLLLAAPEKPVGTDLVRRLAGATPSLADGVLVCPTSTGAVVAVDLVTRSILWGHQYPLVRNKNRALQLRMAGVRFRGSGKDLATPVDATATIVDGQVLLAPVESDELLCLDLHSGELLWKRQLESLLFVAGVVNDTAMVVGDDDLSAWHLTSGKPAWEELAVDLPDNARPTGRGFLADGHYYLPTTSPGLLRIDVATGRIVERLPLERSPGNLVALGSVLVSQSAEAIEAFGQPPEHDDE